MFSRRVKARVTSYVSFGTTQKTGKGTSRMYELFILADLEERVAFRACRHYIDVFMILDAGL